MKKYFTILTAAIFFFCPIMIFAATDASISSDNPAVGETIKIYVPNAVITAKIVDIVPGGSPEGTLSQNIISDVKNYAQDKLDQYINLENFSENNPIKTGISQLNEKINNQVSKWYNLAFNNKPEETPKTNQPLNWQKMPAEVFGAIKPYATGKNKYLFLALFVAAVLALFFFLRRRRRNINNS